MFMAEYSHLHIKITTSVKKSSHQTCDPCSLHFYFKQLLLQSIYLETETFDHFLEHLMTICHAQFAVHFVQKHDKFEK